MTAHNQIKQQAGKPFLLFSLACLLLLFGLPPYHAFCFEGYGNFFSDTHDKSNWELTIKDFSIHTVSDHTEFHLRIQDQRHLKFSARHITDQTAVFPGPLQPKYFETLSRLLSQALYIVGSKPTSDFFLNMDLTMYPEYIRKWASRWQSSDLYENWDQMDVSLRYEQLISMMSAFLTSELNAIAHGLGFEITRASMEKMTYPQARQTGDYETLLKPAGIPADVIIPIPLMLYIQMTPLPVKPIIPESKGLYSIDAFFAVAKKPSTSIYISFNRTLNEYGLSGDMIRPDKNLVTILPMTDNEYSSFAATLLKACLEITSGDKNTELSLRTHLESYPELYQKIVQHIHFQLKNSESTVQRPELSHIPFYRYHPGPDSDFENHITPFLQQTGHEFKEFQFSINSLRRAIEIPGWETSLKPLGFKPEDLISLPGIVYLIASKTE